MFFGKKLLSLELRGFGFILLVDQPFTAELPAQDEPERTGKEKRQRKSL